MQLSPLQLKQYWVTSLGFAPCEHFDPESDLDLKFDSIKNHVNIRYVEEPVCCWQVDLSLAHEPGEEENAPYRYQIQVAGFFTVDEGIPEEKVKNIVKVNGASLLFGIAREQLRAALSSGPYPSVLLPSVSFRDLVEE